jgi:outer membrane receptor protein involved in Fe transport
VPKSLFGLRQAVLGGSPSRVPSHAGFVLAAVTALTPLHALPAQQPQPRVPAADTGRAARDTGGVARDSLTRRPVTLQAVTITATAPLRDEPSSAVHLGAAAIRRAPAANAYDLLRQGAGLEVHDQGQGPGFASDASLRGFSSDHSTDLALWVDGVPVNEPVNGHAEGYADWNLLLPQAITGADVLKGPTSVLFGNFAMAGVVNVQTLERLGGTRVTLRGGSAGRVEGTLLTGVDDAGTGAVLGVRALREDGWRPHAGYQLGQIHGRVVRQLGGLTTLDAGVELYGTRWDSPGFLPESLFAQRRYGVVADPTDGGFKRRAQERVSLRVITGSTLWRSTVYATQGRWQLFLTIPPEPGSGEGTGSQTEEEDRRYGFGATSALTWVLPRAEVTVGAETRWDHADFQSWLTTARRRESSQTLVAARQASGAVFAQATVDVGRHLRASLGVRGELSGTRVVPVGGSAAEATRGVLAPKLGLLYHIPGVGALYGNVSRGYRRTDGVITDPTLPFITEWAYEAGVKIDRGAVSGSVALFRMDVGDEQTLDPVTLRTTSGGASRRRGVEVEATVRPNGSLVLGADWTFNDARYRRLVTEADTLNSARVFNTARYVGTVHAAVAPPARRWHAGVSVNVVGPYSPFDEPGVVLPAFALVHLSGGVRLGRRGLAEVGIRNVLNRAYPELRAGGYLSPGQPRSLFVTVEMAP